MIFFWLVVFVAILCDWIEAEVPVNSFLLQEFGDGVHVDEKDDRQDEFSFSAWNSFAIGEEFAPLVFDIIFELKIEVQVPFRKENRHHWH